MLNDIQRQVTTAIHSNVKPAEAYRPCAQLDCSHCMQHACSCTTYCAAAVPTAARRVRLLRCRNVLADALSKVALALVNILAVLLDLLGACTYAAAAQMQVCR